MGSLSALPPASDSRLFQPLPLGTLNLSNRLIMAPLTRFRSPAHIPLPLVREYYAQRASVPGTLLITEATFISPRASGYENVPGIYSPEQIAAWKTVTDAVHAKGSYIFCQLWALGRAADKDVLQKEGGYDVVSSSAIAIGEGQSTPRGLSVEEIKDFVADYANAAKCAIEAGFDGVEIHGANGYLVDQFTQDVCNHRTDGYGGSVENRSRFGLEVAKAVVEAVGKERVGIRLSPWSTFQAMKMEDPVPQFTHLIKGLSELGLAYVHIVESRVAGNLDVDNEESLAFALEAWGSERPVLLAGGFKPETARKTADETWKARDVGVVFGRYFIANPDLVFRIKEGVELNKYDRDTFYKVGSPDGYVDYPFSREWDERGWSKL
jgi:NADPH2 dehydrogenase